MDQDNCAKCSLCSNMLKISKGSYKGLNVHLRTKHCIDLSSENSQLKRPNSDLFPEASTSKPDSLDIICEEGITKIKSTTIDSYFEKETLWRRCSQAWSVKMVWPSVYFVHRQI
ncbi:hypothetical protein AVEN_173252-1 [Araneus ventricosus]|uniref:BED-type domain-containing protein n=1 Tax=Araneus ventricosus TaxID=182803 RepID=A0A4Y2HFL6_ARAVE|nr:hypothetical protein AVEN_173252-1 [Araneus ventricosus]